VLAFLAKNRAITDELCAKMLGWRYFVAFVAYHPVRVPQHPADPGPVGDAAAALEG